MRHSPVEDDLTSRKARWARMGNVRIAAKLQGDAETSDLALCDLSPLAIIGIKGPGSGPWLTARGLSLPESIYGTSPLTGGGIVGRLGDHEFMVGGGTVLDFIEELAQDLRVAGTSVHAVEREDASFHLSGSRGPEVLSQMCGVDFTSQVDDRLVLTQVAGISCIVLPRQFAGRPTWRLWTDPSYATYLWDQLTTIVTDLNGRIIGAASCVDGLIPESLP